MLLVQLPAWPGGAVERVARVDEGRVGVMLDIAGPTAGVDSA